MGTHQHSPEAYYAHSRPGLGTEEWETLIDHLREVAELAAVFANGFNSAEWSRLAGLWHDVGKYSDAFQNYLLTANGLEAHIEQTSKVDHSTAGARIAMNSFPVWGKLLAFIIAGHHAGLADAFGSPSSLEVRLDEKQRTIEPILGAPEEILDPGIVLEHPPLEFVTNDGNVAAFQLAFFTRMLFSCLVDADFLATERFMDADRSTQRPTAVSPLPAMQAALRRHLERIAGSPNTSIVSRCRQEVLSNCREAANRPSGLFSLTVPTGGGKTLSSLAFALDHAILHGKQRIVYAIPFTSIIEQTAGVFRDVFADLADGVVLEHHSNLDPENESRSSRLAAENWDAPLVVTTNVQLFESLFAAKTSRCRKIHNLVDSVIILDESQTLPVDRLRPCLAALEELARNYGCTVVLCTATQPAIEFQEVFPIGLRNVCEIIPNREQLYRDMKRVVVQRLGKLTDEELIERLATYDSFLTIVNTKPHAAQLYREFVERNGNDGAFHLSTLMCGQHRADDIAAIRQRLKDKQPCRVISTQLIEAGVDVDFPVVFRALSGIDSIAQAAGRCNREGRQETGAVFVFEPADVRLIGYLKSVAQTASEVSPDFEDLLEPAAVRKYFELHFWKQQGDNQWDKTPEQGVMNCFPPGPNLQYQFRTAADRFRLIDETGTTVFVPYGKSGRRLIEHLRERGPDRFLLRRLQRYTVTLYDHVFRAMSTDFERLHDQYPVLANPSNYDEKLGLRVDRPGFMDAHAQVF